MFGQILKQWFWDMYDHLGRLVLINVILFAIVIPVVWSALLFLASTTGGVTSPVFALTAMAEIIIVVPLLMTIWFAGGLHFAHLGSMEKDPSLREFTKGLRGHGMRVLRFSLLLCLIAAILVLNLWFYFLSGQLGQSMQYVAYGLGGLCFWLLIVLLGIALHALPLVVQEDLPILRCFKFGAYLLLKYPLVTLSTILLLFGMTVIGFYLKFAGILIFGFTGTVMLMNSVSDVIRDVEAKSERLTKEGSTSARPTSWREIRNLEEETEEERMKRARYERTLSDVLRPWGE